jgi:histidyl-tRNA synthetase
LDLELDDFHHVNVEKFLSLNIDWLAKLVHLQDVNDIEQLLPDVPEEIQDELKKIQALCVELKYSNMVIAPLYYAKMLYYDELFFRLIDANETYAMGGRYKNDETVSVGFAIYTDVLIDKLDKGL